MKIFITGGTGNIGKLLIQKLINDELIVTARALSKDFKLPQNATFEQLDVTNYSLVEELLSKYKPDVIVHLAAILGADCEKNPELAKKINTQATENLALMAVKYKVKKFLFSSTAAVYTQTELKPVKENDVKPYGVYGKTKYKAEKKLKAIAQKTSLQIAILRIFNVYGPGFNESLIRKLVNSDAENPAQIIDPDNFVRDYIHIDDVCHAFILSIRKSWQGYQVFNVASGISRSTTQLIKELEQTGKKVYYTLGKGISDRVSWANIDKLKKFLDISLETKLIIDDL